MVQRIVPRSFSTTSKSKPFQIFTSVSEIRQERSKACSVGLVPTMGALHDGHLALIRRAARENQQVYISIYVNPTQFGVNEDLSTYPKTWLADKHKISRLHAEFEKDDSMKGQITAVFMPSSADMYPTTPPTSELDGEGTFITVSPLSSRLEGASRPVFFRGVATVCMKLFNIMQPEKVYFGQKDIQQTLVIKKMVKDLHINTVVSVEDTIREHDGLAMSSRNIYLGERRRKLATALYNSFTAVQGAFVRGARRRSELYDTAMDHLTTMQRQQAALPPSRRARFEVDYISIAHPETLEELEEAGVSEGAILSGAIKMLPLEEPQEEEELGVGMDKGSVRLIDNVRLEVPHARAS